MVLKPAPSVEPTESTGEFDILAFADLHMTNRVPKYVRNEVSMFEQSMLSLEEIRGIAKYHKVREVVFVGDWFDAPTGNITESQMFDLITELRHWSVPIKAIPGNHDVKNYNYTMEGVKDSQFGTLIAAGVVKLAIDSSYVIKLDTESDIISTHKNKALVHALVSNTTLPIDESKYLLSEDLMQTNPHIKLFLCGDNHQSFVTQTNDQLLINCGSIARSAINQYDHEPCVWLINSETLEWRRIVLQSLLPAEQYYKVTPDEVEKKEKKTVSVDVQKLLQAFGNKEVTPDPIEVIKHLLNDRKVADAVRNKIEEWINANQRTIS